ncbi:MAG: DsbA family protein [Candidatus Paceibacterota bacterium]|jgi:protein-disulfide isomerase
MENKSYAVPIVVVIAIIIIVSAVFFYQGPEIDNGQIASVVQSLTPLLQPTEDINLDSLRVIDKKDRLLGEIDAPVKLIIYSDLECPACAWFHNQVNQITDYVKEGKLVIAFRHFPLDSIHSNARNLATATECAGKIGGDEKFWQFIDFVFAAPDKSTKNLITDAAEAVDLDSKMIAACQIEEETIEEIEAEYQEAINLGAQGTPFIVIAGPNDFVMPIFGGREAKDLKQAIDILLVDEQFEIETETEEITASYTAE